jgi:outer membrane lipase/esterase
MFGVKMMFSGTLRAPIPGLARALVMCAAVAATLAACGGGTTQQQTFTPTRVISFGDETSLLRADGSKFSVNALNADNTLDCNNNPLWVQLVAASYNFVFAECPSPAANTTPTTTQAFMRATAGAKAADLKTQVDAMVAAGGFTSKDLVTMLAGANDVLELYAAFPTRTEADLVGAARARGDAIAAQVNRVVGLGGKVIVSTVIDLGVSPYAVAQDAAFPGSGRAALLSKLTSELNARIRVGIVNDGRFVGLVLADEMVQVMVRAPSAFGLTDATTVACAAALPDCNTNTLTGTATAATWLWADGTRMAAGGHARLGLLAQQRALNNPFF